jgi:putative GTP pyrophosphokinase
LTANNIASIGRWVRSTGRQRAPNSSVVPPPFAEAASNQLGERPRKALTVEDLRLLDQYRREFRPDYDAVVMSIKSTLGLDASGRPAKSTSAILDKLKRRSARLSQMQDIAGCRVIVANILAQDAVVNRLTAMFPSVTVDRRERPSHGYRAVHVVARLTKRPIEIQVRTSLQQLWAELSEKASDAFGIGVKYGDGPMSIREVLDGTSELLAKFEAAEPLVEEFRGKLVGLRSDKEASVLELSTDLQSSLLNVRTDIEANLLKLIAVFKDRR